MCQRTYSLIQIAEELRVLWAVSLITLSVTRDRKEQILFLLRLGNQFLTVAAAGGAQRTAGLWQSSFIFQSLVEM